MLANMIQMYGSRHMTGTFAPGTLSPGGLSVRTAHGGTQRRTAHAHAAPRPQSPSVRQAVRHTDIHAVSQSGMQVVWHAYKHGGVERVVVWSVAGSSVDTKRKEI